MRVLLLCVALLIAGCGQRAETPDDGIPPLDATVIGATRVNGFRIVMLEVEVEGITYRLLVSDGDFSGGVTLLP